MKLTLPLLAVIVLGLAGCSSVYYGTMEKMGVHKRDIMVDRVEEARDSRNEAKQQFLAAMEQFKSVVNFRGGELEEEYDKLNTTLKKTEAEAQPMSVTASMRSRMSPRPVQRMARRIKQYSSDSLRRESQRKYDVTERKYEELIKAMKRAESKLEPALVPLRDQVLFMKHNLNARAIAGLSDEVISVQTNVDKLIRDMESAIAEADKFIAALREEFFVADFLVPRTGPVNQRLHLGRHHVRIDRCRHHDHVSRYRLLQNFRHIILL